VVAPYGVPIPPPELDAGQPLPTPAPAPAPVDAGMPSTDAGKSGDTSKADAGKVPPPPPPPHAVPAYGLPRPPPNK
jgi:hypothetical protein